MFNIKSVFSNFLVCILNDDPYIWMEDLENPRVLDFIEKENKRFKVFVNALPEIMHSRVARYYYKPSLIHAQSVGKDIFLLKQGQKYTIERLRQDGTREVIIDSEELGEDVILTFFKVDPSEKVMAYHFSRAGSDIMTVNIVDIDTKEEIDSLRGSIRDIIFLDRDRFYFVKTYRTEKTPDNIDPPTSRIFLRERGEDTLVFGSGIPTSNFITMKESVDRENIIIGVFHGWVEGKIYGGYIDDPDSWKLLYEAKGFPVDPIGALNGRYYALFYDENGFGKVVEIDYEGGINEIIGEELFPLRSAAITRDRIIVEYLLNASSMLRIYDFSGKKIMEETPDIPSTIQILGSSENICLLKQETFWVPYKLVVFEKDSFRIIDSVEIKGNFEIEENFIESKDKTKIHYFVVKKKGSPSRNVLVFGYGGFGISLTPRYVKGLMPFLLDGGIYVVANIRGGGEYGEHWHRMGMRNKKQNVFDDFISVLEYFKKRKYKVAALGRSNGGLLVGAVVTQRPDVLDIAIIGYPVLDMLRFHKLYIGRAWITEYGNPDKPEDREYLLKYSPYHNIDPKKKYPLILVYTGLHDDRVHPAHALKFVAKMRETGASIYLRVETKSGHIGSAPKTRIKEITDILAFIYKSFLVV